MANQADSDANVVTLVGVVLERLITAFSTEVSELKFVYDEKLSYESAASQFRANNSLDSTSQDLYPLFAFKRSVLRHAKDGSSKRTSSMRMTQFLPPNKVKVYRSVHGEIDVDFLYITKSMQDLERFEISYLSEEGFPNTKELYVSIPELGEDPLKYFVTYGELSDKVVEGQGVYYKAVSGTMVIRGYYPVLTGVNPAIMQVTGNIFGRNKDEIFFSTTVSAP